MEERFNIDVIEVGQETAHDVATSISVAHSVGVGGERVATGAQPDTFSDGDVRRLAEFAKGVSDGIAPPLAAALGAEHQGIGRAPGAEESECVNRLRPEGNRPRDIVLGPGEVSNALVEIDGAPRQGGAVFGAKPTVQSQQDHAEQVRSGNAEQGVDVASAEHSLLPLPAHLRLGDALESGAELRRTVDPALFFGVVEGGEDGGALAVEGVGPELLSESAPVLGKIVGLNIGGSAPSTEPLNEATKGAAVLLVGADLDHALPVVKEPGSDLAHGHGADVSRGARLSSGVEIPLRGVVFADRTNAIATGAEVVENTVDPLLKTPVLAGTRGEVVDGIASLGLARHSVGAESSQPSIHGKVKNSGDSRNDSKEKGLGSVAQRQSRGLIRYCDNGGSAAGEAETGNPTTDRGERKPIKSQNSSQPTTPVVYTYFVQGCKGGPIKIGKAIDPKKRLKELQTGHPYRLIQLLVLKGDRESELHARFAQTRCNGEWFEQSEDIHQFIKENQGNQAVEGAGGLDSGNVPEVGLPLLIGHLIHTYEADTWVDAAHYADEKRADEVYDLIATFHKESCGQALEACDCEDPDLCECESEMTRQGVKILLETPLHGLLLRKSDLAIIAVLRWPKSLQSQRAIERHMENAAFFLDAVCFQLHAILLNRDSTFKECGMGYIFAGEMLAGAREPESFPAPLAPSSGGHQS